MAKTSRRLRDAYGLVVHPGLSVAATKSELAGRQAAEGVGKPSSSSFFLGLLEESGEFRRDEQHPLMVVPEGGPR